MKIRLPRTLARARVGLLMLGLPALVQAANFDSEFTETDDFGNVGLLQTPTARMRADGQFGFGVSTDRPYNQAHLFLQLLPWLETTLRYTDITDEAYGPLALTFNNHQHYKDKSADLKIHLLGEDEWWPELAFGIQDVVGTGLFDSEYLVASYHFFDLDFSGGLGWGRLGAGGEIPNPFRVFGHHFDQPRGLENVTGTVGDFRTGSLFTGKTIGAFGGIEWNTPVHGLRLQVEYDANDYQHEAFDNQIRQDLPVNFGLAYSPVKGVELATGYERGNRFSARIDLGLNFNQFRGVPKVSDPPIQPVQVHALHTDGSEPLAEAAERDFVLDLKQQLLAQGVAFYALNYLPESNEVQVWFYQGKYRNPARAIGRVARVLSNTAPDKVGRFTLINVQSGVETWRFSVSRSDFERAANGQMDSETMLEDSTLAGPTADAGVGGLASAQVIDDTQQLKFYWDLGPGLRQNIGGPDEFYATQIWARLDGGVAVTDHLSVDATVGANIWNNFDKLQQTSNSTLPHVRSDIVQYLKQGQNNLVKLEFNYIWSPLDEIFARASGGIFEEMYGGVAGELLYRPYGRRWAIGLDGNYVVQRGFDQRFDFRSYRVATGFVSLYYEVPFYHVLATLSAGRYLAKDRGATLELSRLFDDGIRAGVFATKTNVSAAQFGEGSFDKGLFLSIPLDLFFTSSTRSVATAVFRPLTRDGGQRARDGNDLYDATYGSSPDLVVEGWPSVLH